MAARCGDAGSSLQASEAPCPTSQYTFSRVAVGSDCRRPQCEARSNTAPSQAKDRLSAAIAIHFRNTLTVVPSRNRLDPGRSRRYHFAGGRRTCLLGFTVGLLAGFANVNPALEISAVFDADALRDHVPGERAFAADVHAIAGCDVAADFAEYHDLARRNVGRDHTVAAHGHTVTGQVDGTLHPAVNVERLRAGDFAFDNQRLAQRGLLLRVDRRAGRTRRALRLGSWWSKAALRLWAGRWGGGRSVGWFPHVVRILSEVNSAWRGTGFAKPELHSSSSEPAGLVRLIRVIVPCTPMRARDCDVIIATIQRVLVSGNTPPRIFLREFSFTLSMRIVTGHEKLRQRQEIVSPDQ